MLAEVTFGAWLRQQRRLLDLTQQELADQVGCARIAPAKLAKQQARPRASGALSGV